jgi:ATP-dependent Clp protease ATP-binding subunit ClpC
MAELKKTFNPEFLNRVDELVVFHPLEKGHLLSIIDLLISELNRELVDQELILEMSQDVKDWLLERYYKPAYGARPMRRAIQKEIENPLSEEILKGKFRGSNKIRVVLEAETPVFLVMDQAPALTGVS